MYEVLQIYSYAYKQIGSGTTVIKILTKFFCTIFEMYELYGEVRAKSS
jgi:hypothetical protein